MASEVVKNTFEGGINGDISPAALQPNQYLFSKNLSIVGDGKFTSLQNIKGTTTVNSIITSTGTEVLGVFATKYKIGLVENVNCLTIFTATASGSIKIFCNDIENNVLYELYTKTTPADYLTDDRVIDAVNYAETGLDLLYFTDNYYGVRKLRCEIPVGYVPDFLDDSDLDLSKKTAIGDIALYDITSGGSLLTGTYQIAYQLIDPTRNKYTRFSLLTNPIHVYTTISSLIYAGVGLPSNKKIIINITPTAEELANYTHFRLAIVENIYPEGTDVNTLSQIGLSHIELISTYLSGSTITQYPITSNVQTDTTTIDEIVIDLAAIEKVKTLDIRANRLLVGNITFKDTSYNNGTPVITGGSILKQVGIADSFSSDVFTSRYKGHFRDEVYRYAISYFDEHGNFSSPSTLDTSAVTNNQITGGLKDFKFPDRSQLLGGQYYTIFDGSNNTQSLGLQFTGVNNHPKWAKGFVILRAKRKKNIKFQTPMIPLVGWYGVGSIGEYPTLYNMPGAATSFENLNATPMGPSLTYLPASLLYGNYPEAPTTFTANSGAGFNTIIAGENYGMRGVGSSSSFAVYPPETMYSKEPYQFNNSEQIRAVDASICRMYFKRFDSESYNCGLGINTNCSASFFSSLNNDYYYNSGHGGAKVGLYNYISSTYVNGISGNRTFDNYDNGALVNGRSIVEFNKLETGNIDLGIKGNVQRFTAITTTDSVSVLGGVDYRFSVVPSLTFASGTPVFVTEQAVTHKLLTSEFITSTTGLYGSYVNIIPIVNIKAGLDDSRYGGIYEFNEFIYTGTKVVFTTGELVTVAAGGSLPKTVDVWGGDCIVSPHTFKIADTSYALENQPKSVGAGDTSTTVVNNWTKAWFVDTSDASVILPVPVKGASQYLTVVLESEFHGSVRDLDTYDTIGTYNFPIRGISNDDSKVRAPLTYNYNINLTKENDEKIFVPLDPTQPVNNRFKARIYFSDVKIYQTNIEGFDVFRVGNFNDLPERYGALTKLQVAGDNLYSLQESAIAYIPIGERVIEATNTSQLGIRTGELLGEPLFINTMRGCQHLRSVVNTGNSVYFVDNANKGVYTLEGQTSNDITNKGFLTIARSTSFLDSTLPEKSIFGVYDPLRGEYWATTRPGNSFIWNEKFESWISEYTFPSLFGGVFTNNKLYLVGNNTGANIQSATMYTGNPNQLFSSYVPEVSLSFVINPNPDSGKTFDDVSVASSDRLSTLDLTVERESILGNQVVTGMNLVLTSRGEGTFRIKTLRTASMARLRGLYAIGKLNWITGVDSKQVNLFSISTKFRASV